MRQILTITRLVIYKLQLKNVLTNSIYLGKLLPSWYSRGAGTDTEAVAQRCSVEKVFLEILQNLQENICATVSLLTKLQALGLQLY